MGTGSYIASINCGSVTDHSLENSLDKGTVSDLKEKEQAGEK